MNEKKSKIKFKGNWYKYYEILYRLEVINIIGY